MALSRGRRLQLGHEEGREGDREAGAGEEGEDAQQCDNGLCDLWGASCARGAQIQIVGLRGVLTLENKGFQILNEERSGVLFYFLQKSIDP